MNIPESILVYPLAGSLPEQLSALGKISGIYAFVSAAGMTHLSWSTNLSRRLKRLLCVPTGEPSALGKRLHNSATVVQCWPTGSRLESSLLLYQLARVHFPDDYLTRLRLRMPWFVALVDNDRFARVTITNRLGRRAEPVIGPFPSRETAQRYEEELLTAFQIRRCSEELNPAPEHPGCIYGEMNLCLRPCQGAVSSSAYRREADAVKDLLLTNGRNTLDSLSRARDKAASETDFETAAQIHKRIEKLKSAADGRDEVIADIQNFNGIALTKGVWEDEFRLWPMLAGYWQEPITLKVAGSDLKTPFFGNRLKDLLAPVFLHPSRDGQQAENLAVFARWYYSSWRDGDWIAFTQLDSSVYRKLVRSLTKQWQKGTKSEPAILC